MRTTLVTCLITVLVSGPIFAQDICPVCKHKTVLISEMKDDRSLPSKNVDVWNRSSCGFGISYGEGSTICPHDYYAYDADIMSRRHFTKEELQSYGLRLWSLTLGDKDGFGLHLDKDIYNFPIPSGEEVNARVLYHQSLNDLSDVEHGVTIWVLANDSYIRVIETYAVQHKIQLSIEGVCVRASKIIKQNQRVDPTR